MRKVSLAAFALAGAVAAMFSGSAKASFIAKTLVEPGPTAGTEAVSLYILGTGSDAQLFNFVITAQDNSGAHLVMGSFQVTSGPPAGKGFFSDAIGGQSGVAAYATPAGASASYSWIGNGEYNPSGLVDALHVPVGTVNVGDTSVSYGPYSTAAANPWTGPLAAFHIEGGWQSAVDASGGALSGTGNGMGALLAVAVAPVGDNISFNGSINSGPGNPGTFNTLVPEPASIGVLALGGVALLARRRKA